ncbi:Protein of unknown function [Kaistia soli DSM 19436]|uniref:DUF1488 domain-containing protein n=2 Tax=Kaistia TaxID=166953 RepID=A0A1M5FL65_9HYPH|nr:Protein of unknown function [Kaistia soli DSM 19436]
MSLNFPNQSRSYNASHDCVCFWGHESQFEVAFQIGSDALKRLNSTVPDDEEALLRVFDGNRVQIQKVAARAHAQKPDGFHRLSATDFG